MAVLPIPAQALTGTKTIVVIDDDDYVQDYIRIVLENSNYTVRPFGEFDRALQSMKRDAPDLVIVDFMLPKIYGTEIYSEIRKDEKLRNVPVILMSSVERSKIPAGETKIDYFLPKPPDPALMLSLIEKLLFSRGKKNNV